MSASRDASPDTPPELTRRRFLAAGGAAAALVLAPSLVNTPEDVETALAAVRAIAGA